MAWWTDELFTDYIREQFWQEERVIIARDTMTYGSYEPGSFDNPPKGPVGIRRGAHSVMARLCPFVAVTLVVTLYDVRTWTWISREYKNVVGGSSQTATTPKSDSSDKTETKNSTKDDSSSTSTGSFKDSTLGSIKSDTGSDTTSSNENQNSDQQSQQSGAIVTVNKATQVRVVNATGIQGYTGQQADMLQTAGHTSVEAINPNGTLPASSAVQYQDETDKATAEDVATTLDASAVEQV